MSPGFLHLEDLKSFSFLESLLINGTDDSNVDRVLSAIYAFYSDLYGQKDVKTIDEIVAFLDSIPSLP